MPARGGGLQFENHAHLRARVSQKLVPRFSRSVGPPKIHNATIDRLGPARARSVRQRRSFGLRFVRGLWCGGSLHGRREAAGGRDGMHGGCMRGRAPQQPTSSSWILSANDLLECGVPFIGRRDQEENENTTFVYQGREWVALFLCLFLLFFNVPLFFFYRDPGNLSFWPNLHEAAQITDQFFGRVPRTTVPNG